MVATKATDGSPRAIAGRGYREFRLAFDGLAGDPAMDVPSGADPAVDEVAGVGRRFALRQRQHLVVAGR